MTDDLDDLIRRTDPDRWLSSRFIGDAQARADVIAIYAYDHELARAPKVASNPLLGEIRLTWWGEVLDEVFEGRAVRRHPTAQALAEVVRRRGLPREPLAAMIDARYRELDATPMTEAEALEWARDTGGRAAELAVRILDPAQDPDQAVAAGAAWALLRKGLTVQGTVEARAGARRLSAAAFPAVAHAAFAIRPARSDLARRVRLIWAVARGRL
ncbi:squalene/phytoene synthase family protein [Phenylobacterium sp.]|uniref:squalene/phytoene synthase family protein n=1 Tax=Phenylobacterium sp. TaxID=1871053 RepID=UPI0028123670|nr:squalene/phytoene synthase family protein [Phenylobacterium sp.]